MNAEIVLLTELDDDFSKVIWVSSPYKEPDIADFPFILWLAPKLIFLYIRNTLHKKANREEDYSSNIPSGAKVGLTISCDIRRVQNGNG